MQDVESGETLRAPQECPCLGFCTTALGDDVCKSCGRTFEEVCDWNFMTIAQKQRVWDRLMENGWWLKRYQEKHNR